MLSGLKNLTYLSWGARTYGEKPVLQRRRDRWEFQFIFSGRARPTGVDLPALAAGAGPRLYVSHPASPHGWTDDRLSMSEVFVVQFIDVPDELDKQVSPERPLVVDLDEATVDRMERRCEDAKRAIISAGAKDSLFFQRLLMELATVALSQAKEVAGRMEASDKIARAMNWFEENIAGNPSVADGARAAGVSVAHLRRLFAEAGRPSPQAELVRLRMEAAKRCLSEGWAQKAVAEYLGFSEPSAFARAFRDHEGMPPGEWSRRHWVGGRRTPEV